MRMNAADCADTPLERFVERGLRAHRARLGHAVGDGHLAHVHLGDAAAHDLDRARRTSHDSGAQAGEIEALELRMSEFGDEHRRHTIQSRAALRFDRLEEWPADRSPSPG